MVAVLVAVMVVHDWFCAGALCHDSDTDRQEIQTPCDAKPSS